VSEDKYGNRSSDASTNEITIDLTPPEAPTVNGTSGDDPSPMITGTMDPDSATFAVSLAGTVYSLGKDESLTVDGKGGWSLKPAKPLSVGRHDAVAVSADQYGNRSSDTSVDEIEILEKKTESITPPSLDIPTVKSASVTVARPPIEGTWDEKSGTSLKVTLADRSYVLGTDENLTSDGSGNWVLNVPAPLRDGVYDIKVDTTAPGGLATTDSTANELLVDAAGPASPTVNLYSGSTSPAEISGTWDAGSAATLTVKLNGRTFELGQSIGFYNDDKGNWRLQNGETLPPGSYDVVATSTDKAGRTSSDQTKFEILVKAVESAQPVPQPIVETDCGTEIAKLLVLSPLMFETAKSKMKPEGQATIARAAELMASCPDKKFQIAGHTDSRASSAYNQALSERRAVQVRKALVAAGVPSSRLSAVGYGEARPLASNETDEGMTLNRRIEITVIN
jgi:outer membrane protein OmpA-like peptidoglycan-associated protein